jgi:hypothetical protein
MVTVKAAQDYRSRCTETRRLELPDGSRFKVYVMEITGRANPERYEWRYSSRTPEQATRQLGRAGAGGVGFVCLFPHIAKVFFFGETLETNLYAQAWHGNPWMRCELEDERGCEIACAGEMDVAGKEFALWRRAASVEEYLARFVEPEECGFRAHRKLYSYAAGPTS